jgi:hypothetical protein
LRFAAGNLSECAIDRRFVRRSHTAATRSVDISGEHDVRRSRRQWPSRRGISTAALWLGLLLGEPTRPAWAQATSPADAVEAREAEARTACLAGKADRGIEILARLFTDTADPNYLFNQGRCFQQNDRPEEAISRFREYLRKAKDLTKDELDDVERLIKECEDLREERQRGKALPVSPAHEGPGAQVGRGLNEDERDAATGRRMRLVGITSAAVGAAAIGFGVVMGLRVSSLENDFEREHSTSFNQREYNSGQRSELLQWVGYAVGGVALGTGAIFYFLGQRSEKPVAAAVWPSPGGLTATLRVRL